MNSANSLALEIRNYRSFLATAFELTAEWRSGLVEQYPEDDRNTPAANELLRLAETVNDVPDALMIEYIAFSRTEDIVAVQRESEMQRSIGFHRDYRSAVEFVRELVS